MTYFFNWSLLKRQSIFLVFLMVMCIVIGAKAQNIPFKKQYFKKKGSKLREALKQLNMADEILEIEQDYDKALPYYLKVYKLNSQNISLNYKIVKCYLFGDRNVKTEALPYLHKIVEIDSINSPEVYYLLGITNQYAAQWETAIKHYQHYLKKIPIDHKNEKLAIRNIAQCKNGILLNGKRERLITQNLGRRINSALPEYGAVFTPHFKKMYFTSRRNKTTGFDIDTDFHYYEDIYEASLVDGKWNRVKNIGDGINTNGHEAVLSISHDGNKMLIYRGDHNGDIYLAEKQKKSWKTPTALPSPINSKYRETAACFSADGKTIYFTSDRTGTLGGLDIFKSEYKRGSGWSVPENLGKNINSSFNEDAVFVDASNQILYFSSNSEASIGGYDIFKSEQKNGSWEEKKNLGIPLNTPYDDMYYVTDSLGQIAYYTSKKEDTKGATDIYKVIYLSPEKPVHLIGTSFKDTMPTPNLSLWLQELINEKTTAQSVVLNGEVKTKDGNLVTVDVLLEDMIQQALVYEDSTKSGKFSFTLSAQTKYKLLLNAKGYLPVSEEVFLDENADMQFELEPLKKGGKITLSDIYFATGSDILSEDSYSSLKQLHSFLIQNAAVMVMLVGHTDNVGDKNQNLQLSEKRAKSVRQWLIKKGIAKNRLGFKGKGDTSPIGDNNSAEGRQKNRRTEIVILKTGK